MGKNVFCSLCGEQFGGLIAFWLASLIPNKFGHLSCRLLRNSSALRNMSTNSLNYSVSDQFFLELSLKGNNRVNANHQILASFFPGVMGLPVSPQTGRRSNGKSKRKKM